MKSTLIFAALIVAFAVNVKAQTITYQIDQVSTDSIYLVETIEAAVTPEAPRPNKQVFNMLFKSRSEIEKLVKDMEEKAIKQQDEAEKLAKSSLLLNSRAQTISALINEMKQ